MATPLKDRQKPCPACGVEIGEHCVTGNGKQASGAHQARISGSAGNRNKIRSTSRR